MRDLPINYRAPNAEVMTIRHDTNTSTVSSMLTTDVRGSVHTLISDDGRAYGGFGYTDFGITERQGWGGEEVDIAYVGGRWDQDTGLYYQNARFYNPVDARFLQVDVARNGEDLRATLSLYGYTEGDPMNKVDPTGYRSARIRFARRGNQTTYLSRVLRVNASWAISQRNRHIRNAVRSGLLTPRTIPARAMTQHTAWFYNMMQARGPWDLKLAAPSRFRSIEDARAGRVRITFRGRGIAPKILGIYTMDL